MSDDALAAIIALLICAATVVGAVFFKEYRCSTQAEMMGFRYSWGPIQGCMIKPDGGGNWIPLDKWRSFD